MRTVPFFIALCALWGSACAQEPQQIEKQIQKHQTRLETDPNNVEVYYQLGHAHLTLGRYEQGVSYLKDAVRLSKKHALAHRDLGWALYQLKEYRAAEPWLLKALEMKPRDRATLSSLSAVYIGQKTIPRCGRPAETVCRYRAGHGAHPHQHGKGLPAPEVVPVGNRTTPASTRKESRLGKTT